MTADTAAVWLTIAAGITSCAGAGIWIAAKVRMIIIRQHDIGELLHRVASEFTPNGGSSLRDAINRLEARHDALAERFDSMSTVCDERHGIRRRFPF